MNARQMLHGNVVGLLMACLAVSPVLAQSTGQSQVIERYYQTILGRAADASGLAFWLSEAARMTGEGVDPAEALRAVAVAFHGSPEFAARGLSDSAFIDNLYPTFYDRAADAAGSSYWLGQMAAGLSRDMLVNSFLFSTEFGAYVTATAGAVPSRGEVYAVIDFYRGAFGRLPDTGGLRYWLGEFRSAQCQSTSTRAAAVRLRAGNIAVQFFAGVEYTARGRSNVQYVGDLYNAFLRRGADAAGFAFWVGALDGSTQTRAQVLQSFIDSTEFATRVAAVAAAGCVRLGAPTVANVAATTIAAVAYNSSSKLDVAWQASDEIAATSYKVTAVDAVAGESSSITATGTSARLTGLKSATTYSISVAPCVAFATATVCLDSPVNATTAMTHRARCGTCKAAAARSRASRRS